MTVIETGTHKIFNREKSRKAHLKVGKMILLQLLLLSIATIVTFSMSYAEDTDEAGFRVIEGIPHLPAVVPSSIASPSPGMIIYSTVDKCPLIFNGKRWGNLCDNDLSTNTIEDYFVVKKGIPFLPVKSTLTANATSGAIYYSSDLKSTMIYNGTSWVRIADMPNNDYELSKDFGSEGGEIKTCKLPVLDKDPESTELYEGAFYINSVSKSIRFYDGTAWKDISCIAIVKTLDISNITDVNTCSGGDIISNSGSAITIRGICWDVNPNPEVSLSTKTESFSEAGFEVGEFPDTLVNLMANTTYYVRAYAVNCAGVAYGEDKTFKTIHGIPEIITLPVQDITSTTATGGGDILSNGGAAILKRGICWSSKGDPINDPDAIITNDGSGVGEYPSDLVGLMGVQKYYVRAYAVNRYGKAYGNLVEFTSQPAVPPVLSLATLNITDITNTSAVGEVTVLSNGGALVTEAGICWSADKIHWNYVPSKTKNSTDIGTFFSKMEGLMYATLYYVKGYAINEVDTSYSSESSFITTSYPELSTLKPSKVKGYSFSSGGDITNNGDADILSCGLCWSKTKNPTTALSTKTVQNMPAPGTGMFISDIEELEPDTKYYVRAYAINTHGTAYGNQDSLTTAAFPTVTTDEVISITNISAQAGGEVVKDGRQPVVSRGICWGTIPNPSLYDNHVVLGSGIGNFTYKIEGLMGNRTYYVRSFAINSVGTSYGESVSFKTAPPVLPELVTGNAYNIGGTTAWSSGNITQGGGAEITSRGLVWSTDPEFDPEKVISANKVTAESNGTGSYGCKMTGLTPNTTYYVRSFATNSVGSQYGNRISFSTFTVPTVITSPASQIENTSASGGGNIVSDGGAIVTQSGICWSTKENPTIHDKNTSCGIGIGSFLHEMNNLMGSTKYYVRAYAINCAGITYGNQESFTTNPPVLATLATTWVRNGSTGTTAVCGGNIISNGGDTITITGLSCSKVSGFNPVNESEITTKQNGSGNFSSTLTGLQPGTKYYVRAYVETEVGTAYANNEISFTTFDVPEVKTIAPEISYITSTDAVCGGNIISNGGTEITQSGICWGIAPEPTISDYKKERYTSLGSFTASADRLFGSTRYYVRAYAKNSVGISYGNEISFTTLPPVLATLTTNAPRVNSESTAISGGDISSNGGALVTTRGIYWSTQANFEPNPSSINKTEQTGYFPDNYMSVLKDLIPNTIYYIRSYVVNKVGTAYGNQVSFRMPDLPKVSTNAPYGVKITLAWSGGNVSDDGGADISSRGVVWSTDPGFIPSLDTGNKTVYGGSTGGFSSEMTHLRGNTTYYVRAYATNIAGTTFGNMVSFTTDPCTIATLTTSPPDDVTGSSVLTGGDISDDGGDPVTDFGVIWSTQKDFVPNLSKDDKTSQSRLGARSFSSRVSELNAGTTYYLRAYAINGEGVAYGNQVSFTTLDKPTVTTNTVFPASTGRDAIGGGIIISDGGTHIWNQGVCWSTSTNPTIGLYTKTSYDKLTYNRFTSNLSKLEPVTKYYVRAYATNNQGTSYGEEVEFTTLPALPTLSTNYVTILTPSSVSSGGEITDDGGAAVAERGVVWSTSSSFNPDTVVVNRTSDGSGNGNYRSEVTGMQLSLTYYIRAYATNTAGTAYGNQVKVTIFPTAPRLKTVPVTDTTGYSGMSGGIIIHDGGEDITQKGLCWSTEPNPVIIDNPNKTYNGIGTDNFTQKITGLKPNTLYYVRSYAVNKIGTAYGEEMKILTHAVPTLTATTPVIDIIATTAVGGGNITDDGRTPIISRGIVWSRYSNPTIDVATKIVEEDNPGIGIFTGRITGLKPETKYYVRAFATNSVGTNYGSQVYFTTLPVMLPTLSTKAVTEVKSREALSGGDIVDDGGLPVTVRGICWDTLPNPTIELVSKTNDVSGGVGEYSNVLAGLRPHTKYYVRAFATNGLGTGYGQEETCMTECVAPELSLVTVSDITMETAKASATITFDGGAPVTDCGIYWNTADTIAIPAVNEIQDIDNDKNIKALIKNLEPDSTYYVWAFATNKIGKSYSVTPVEFKTPTLPTLITSMPVQVTDSSAVCGGNVTDEGNIPVIKRGICWGDTKTPNLEGNFIEHSIGGPGLYSCQLQDLNPGTKYYIRSFATNDMGTSYGNLDSLTTLDIPTLATSTAIDITNNSAVTGGEITDEGGVPVTARGVCYSTIKPLTFDIVTKTNDGIGDGLFTSKLESLKRVTKYYIRAYATNSVGTGYGELDSLITLPELPVVSNVTMGKMVNGSTDGAAEVLEDGGAEVTSRGLCLSTTGEPTLEDLVVTVDSGIGEFTGTINGLKEGPTYYIRAFATNRAGTAYSKEILNFKICPAAFDIIHTAGLNGAPETKTVTYHSVSTKISGAPRCWLTQNLGADREALSIDDASTESAGWYWQFNRSQGYKHDGATRTPNLAYVPWISSIDESCPWYAKNDPCRLLLGGGWRLPTSAEWVSADGAPQNWSSKEDTYNSVLKLHSAGYLSNSNGSLLARGSEGRYWSNNNYSWYNGYFYNTNGTPGTYMLKTYALPVRCIRDEIIVSLPTVSNVDIPASKMTSSTAECTATLATNGGAEVTSRGYCWSTSGIPTVDSNIIESGSGVGIFTTVIDKLEEGESYFIRAYATNEKGTAYSSKVASFKICPTDFQIIHTAGLNGAPETKTVTYHSVSTFISGAARCWLTQNLGADREALSKDDASVESAGWYWQFNRKQGYKHDGTTRTPNLAYVPWISHIDESHPWLIGNDPCNLLLGAGWRIPTRTEWITADAPPQNWRSKDDTYGSVLKLHSSGYLNYSNGELIYRGEKGVFWSSTNNSWYDGYYYNSNGSDVTYMKKTYALPVRCIRDKIIVNLPSVSNVELPTTGMTTTSATGTATIATDGGAEVTDRGLVWNTSGNPTTADNVVKKGTGTGKFTTTINGMNEGPTYYVRAYATNKKGTAYSPNVTTFKICPTEFDIIHTAGLNGAPESKTITYHSISSSITGEARCWLTQNLGAEVQAKSANDDSQAAAGWYWQFNRKQGYKHDGTTRTPNYAYIPWITRIDESCTWQKANDPCNLLLGGGWRLPTRSEWVAADAPPQNWTSKEDTYNSVLKLHSAGYLAYNTSALADRGVNGYYWSSTNDSWYNGYSYNPNGSPVLSRNKAYGQSIRCIRDKIIVNLPTVSNVDVPTDGMTTTSATGIATIATDGGGKISTRGLCWSTTGTPTIDNDTVIVGKGTGEFTTVINKLVEGPTYHVRAYATNEAGTAYSSAVTTFKVCPTEFQIIHTAGLNGAPETKTVTYHSISSSVTGEARCWLTQNLGAARQALSADDNTEASAGWYWQFNRRQGYKHDETTRTPNYAYVKWITRIDESSTWKAGNDPCSLLLGGGWRMPTLTEWKAADAPPQNWGNQTDSYKSVLKLHSAGYLNNSKGVLAGRGTVGYYWSSTNDSWYNGYTYNTNGYTESRNKALGQSVRCIRDNVVVALPTVSAVSIPTATMTKTTAEGTATIATNGGAKVTERGLCWNTTGKPTVDDNKLIVGNGTGVFSTDLTGLQEGPTYYVRAYAINSAGTSYSPTITTFKICPTEFTVIHKEGLNGSPETKTVTYHSISTDATGVARCWLTQNLGASQQPKSSNDDSVESAGWYWQFNRRQGYKHDGTTRTPNLGYVPWISKIDESNPWYQSNDPCHLLLGTGWRIPTRAEWIAADAPPQNWSSQTDSYNSVLKLHSAGYLNYSNGSLIYKGERGYYWSSTNNSWYDGYFYNTNGVATGYVKKTYGLPVRCIRDNILVIAPSVSNVSIPTTTMTATTAECTSTVTIDGGAEVSTRGFCWNTTGTPTVADNIIPVGSGTGIISATMTGLVQGPTYYVRAYATNSAGTTYSPVVASFKICPTTFNVTHTAGVNGAVDTKTVTYHSITSTISGAAKCWLTQNLGADKQPTSADDVSEAAAGWYWQFNRKKAFKHDGITRTPATGWVTHIDESCPWYLHNDPCHLLLGAGWRLPTKAEWIAVDAPPQYWNNTAATYNSVLKLHASGYLNSSGGTLTGRGTEGRFWSSTNYSWYNGYFYHNNGSNITYMNKKYGLTIRCIKD